MNNRMDVYLETLQEEVPDYISKLEKSARLHEVPIIRRSARNMLRYLIKTQGPERVLEVGTAVGYSALFMSEYLSEHAQLDTIEKVPKRIEEAKKNFALHDAGKKITLWEGDAADVLKTLIDKKKSYSFIFMDAAKGQYMAFLPDILALLEEGGVLVTDNILHEGDILESRYGVTRRDRTIHSRMREYLKCLMTHDQLTTICLPIGDGLTVSTKVRERK